MLLNDLPKQCCGQFLAQATLEVEMVHGSLSSTTKAALLAGANTAVIGSADDADWEVIQFETAELIDVDTYRLKGLIRGQAGTDGIVPQVWPSGARFVLLSAISEQLDIASSSLGVSRTYRYGPEGQGYSDPSYTEVSLSFDGVGLRPYMPCHVLAEKDIDGALVVQWTRRTRIAGDSWTGLDVPIGEETELYEIIVRQDGVEKRRTVVDQPSYQIAAADLDVEFETGFLDISVAQISAIYGAGPAQTVSVQI